MMSIPALRAIRAKWPAAQISILAREWVAEIFQGQGLADRILVFDHRGRHQGFAGVEKLIREVRAEQFDAAVLFQNAFEAAWIAWRAGIPERIGYAREGRGILLTQQIRVSLDDEIPAHESYYYLELLRGAGWLDQLPKASEIQLRVDEGAKSAAHEKLTRAGARTKAGKMPVRVALAPGAAYGSAKCWPTERYAQLCDRLISDFDADVIIFGAGSEGEVATRIAAAMQRKPVMLAGQTSIGELPALFASCDIFIGNDSGAMHVAAAVGLPVVAIFGPTDPFGTAPVTNRKTLVQEKASCSPCFLRHCPVDHRCMTRVGVDAVHSAARVWILGA
ncbi:MAG: lipopolysaccharide heptosyltransferase II [Acidobacteria bacterium]|nr:lipopolysaccharide heptosyltransferase II [Acidobacteriota bacterium]